MNPGTRFLFVLTLASLPVSACGSIPTSELFSLTSSAVTWSRRIPTMRGHCGLARCACRIPQPITDSYSGQGENSRWISSIAGRSP